MQGFDDPDLLAAFPGLAVVDGEGDPNASSLETGEPSAASDVAKEDESNKLSDARAEAECALLERAAHYALMMNADLQVRNPYVFFFSPAICAWPPDPDPLGLH